MINRARRKAQTSAPRKPMASGLSFRRLVLLAICGFVVLKLASMRTKHTRRPVTPALHSTAASEDSFTVLIPTYRRANLLRKALSKLILNTAIDRIIVIWQDPLLDPPAWLTGLGSHTESEQGKVHVRRSAVNSMNERFRPDPRIRTKAVFMCDDDVEIHRGDIDAAFQIWRHWGDHGIVGFTPRSHQAGAAAGGPAWDFVLRPESEYSMIMTNAAFFHTSYLDLYWSERLGPARRHVDKVFNCDDILFNFIVANATSRPPLLLHFREPIRTRFHSPDGLWQRPSDLADRTSCLSHFFHLFGGMPLKHTSLSASRDVHDYAVALPEPIEPPPPPPPREAATEGIDEADLEDDEDFADAEAADDDGQHHDDDDDDDDDDRDGSTHEGRDPGEL